MSNRFRYSVIAAVIFLAAAILGAGYFYQYRFSAIPSEAKYPKLQGIPVLMYHKVNPDPRTGGLGLRVPPDKFDWQMRYLKENGYESVSMADVMDHFEKGKHLPEKPIVITFDDGYKDNYDFAYPIMKKYGFTGTIFVVSKSIGNTNFYDVDKRLQPENKIMDWHEIKELDRAGFVIGAHTVDHPHLAEISPEEARYQIQESKRALEFGLNKPVEFFCYPYGSHNDTVADLVKEAGYRAAVTTQLGLAKKDTHPYKIPRVRVTGHYDKQKFIDELHKY